MLQHCNGARGQRGRVGGRQAQQAQRAQRGLRHDWVEARQVHCQLLCTATAAWISMHAKHIFELGTQLHEIIW